MGGLLVIRRLRYFSDERFRPIRRKPAVPLSDEEIVSAYRGIEGEHWPLKAPIAVDLAGGLAPVHRYEPVLRYFKEASSEPLCDLLYIRPSDEPSSGPPPPSGFVFCGFDYGLFTSEYNHYSVLFNEVIYGAHDDLRKHAQRLNEFLLLPCKDDVEALRRDRDRLAALGADLETADAEGEIFQHFSVHVCPTLMR